MCNRKRAQAFTLVELLVVIGIIALLISILLPTLGRARKSANTIACSANLRSIVQAMQIYASQNNGAIPGSPYTTARFFYRDVPNAQINGTLFGANNFPSVVQTFDWQSPLAKIMGVKFEEGGTAAQRKQRFDLLRDLKAFTCPENDIIATPWPSANPLNATPGRMISYNTCLSFLVQGSATGTGGYGITLSFPGWELPSSYTPKITKVGQPSRKAYIADGAKYSTISQAPDFNTTHVVQNGGMYADQPPCTIYTRSWQRNFSPGNSATSGNDARIYAFRHSGKPPGKGARPDLYKFNVAFFDGHVETLGDLEGSRPEFWYPKGTVIDVNGELYPDVKAKYNLPATYTVP